MGEEVCATARKHRHLVCLTLLKSKKPNSSSNTCNRKVIQMPIIQKELKSIIKSKGRHRTCGEETDQIHRNTGRLSRLNKAGSGSSATTWLRAYPRLNSKNFSWRMQMKKQKFKQSWINIWGPGRTIHSGSDLPSRRTMTQR